MARKQQGLAYIDPDRITRPDTVPSALRFDDASVPSSVFEDRGQRALAPYPSLPDALPSSDEPTVIDGPLQRSLASASSATEDRRASRTTEVPRSGTRNRIPLTPPERAPSKPDSDAHEGARPAQQPQQREHEPATAPGRPPAPWSQTRLFVFVALTTCSSALLGASLGNGSLLRVFETLGGAVAEPGATPLPLAAPPIAPSPDPALASAPRRAPTVEAEKAPVMRFEDLPSAEEDADGARRGSALGGRYPRKSVKRR